MIECFDQKGGNRRINNRLSNGNNKFFGTYGMDDIEERPDFSDIEDESMSDSIRGLQVGQADSFKLLQKEGRESGNMNEAFSDSYNRILSSSSNTNNSC